MLQQTFTIVVYFTVYVVDMVTKPKAKIIFSENIFPIFHIFPTFTRFVGILLGDEFSCRLKFDKSLFRQKQ